MLATQGGVKVTVRPNEEVPLQLAELHVPDIAAGEVGGWMLQAEPEVEAVTLPETPVGTMVPVIVPLSEQLSQATENGMEKVPLLLTTVVPEELAGQLPTCNGTPRTSA
jgi:hypothetical protein